MKTVLILSLVASLALAGCAANNTTTTSTSTTTTSSTPPTSTGPQSLAYTATQTGAGPNTTYMFSGPSTATAGWTHVTLTNNGSEAHQIVFLQLPAGETFAQHMAMMMSNDSSGMDMNTTHANATFVGGIASASPPPPPGAPQPPAGAPAPNVESSWVFLTPGTYVLECEIPGAAGPHALHGMTKELTVTGTAPAMSKDEPTSDLGLTLVDFNFTWSGTPTAGHHMIKVENKGSMPHEGVLLHLAANKTIQDFLAWEQSGAQGAPPAMDTFGAGALSPGQVEYVDATFAPGADYGQICFLPDMAGTPHLAHGMVGQFHIA